MLGGRAVATDPGPWFNLPAGSGIAAAVALISAGVGAVVAAFPHIQAWIKHTYEVNIERRRRREIAELLLAELRNFARHSATNLKRLVEILQSGEMSNSELVLALRKFRFVNEFIEGRKERTFSVTAIEDIRLLPKFLARDVMRMHLFSRNVEYDILESIRMVEAMAAAGGDNSVVVSFRDPMIVARFTKLGSMLQRAANEGEKCADQIEKFQNATAAARGRQVPVYEDKPLQGDDARAFEELESWRTWLQSQKMVSEDRIKGIVQDALAAPQAEVVVEDSVIGSINHVARVRIAGRQLCVRIRAFAQDFQYEPSLIKDVIVARSLTEAAANPRRHYDTEIGSEVERFLRSPAGGPVAFSMGPEIVRYSIKSPVDNRAVLISDWINRAPGRMDIRGDEYSVLGAKIRQLHKLSVQSYYKNFLDIGRQTSEFSGSIFNEIEQRNKENLFVVPQSALQVFFQRVSDAAERVESFCVCHNDLHPLNVVKSHDGEIYIVDWDNTAISHPYLDFVKLKYWSVRKDGMLTPDRDAFRNFCTGYQIESREVLESEIFALLCMLWLFRVYSFERRREAAGEGNRKPFSGSETYATWIQQLCERGRADRF